MRISDCSSDVCSSDLCLIANSISPLDSCSRTDRIGGSVLGYLGYAKLACAAAAIASLAAGCSQAADNNSQNPSAADPTMETAPASLDAASAPNDGSTSVPDHNYDEQRGWSQYYVAAVSVEDRKKGRAAASNDRKRV